MGHILLRNVYIIKLFNYCIKKYVRVYKIKFDIFISKTATTTN